MLRKSSAMIAALRQCLLSCLVIAVTAVSLTVGHARGQARVAGEVVICIGADVITLRVDENGQPTSAHHTCPDCIVSLAGVLGSPPNAAWRAEFSEFGYDAGWRVPSTSAAIVARRARAPPAVV